MKPSRMFSIALIATLAMSSVTYAQGRGGGQSGANASGTQTRIHTPGTGLTTLTPAQTRIHAPGTGLSTTPSVPGQVAAPGGRRGIHTPGTGLATTPPVPAPTAN